MTCLRCHHRDGRTEAGAVLCHDCAENANVPRPRAAATVAPRLSAHWRLLSVVVGCLVLLAAAGAGSATPAAKPPSAPTSAAMTARVSVSSKGAQGNLPSWAEGISADGRYVVFSSASAGLVPGDTNKRQDAFLRDRRTDRTTRVSVSSSGRQGKAARDPFGGSAAEGISAGGRYVVFRSDAANLVAGDTNRAQDIFVRDRKTSRTTRVSVSSSGRQANGRSDFAVISPNGRYVAFSSKASNLVPGDTNRVADVFIRDRIKRTTERVSVGGRGKQANRESEQSAINPDGRYVAFQSNASNLVPGDTNALSDVFVHDRKSGRTTRISVNSRGKQGAGDPTRNGSNAPSISADGRYIAFHSAASNLVRGDTNRTFDIFVHDRVTGKTQRVSISSSGGQANGENIGAPRISANGRYVAYASLASNLVPGDVNDITDAFVRDRRTGRTILVSLSSSGGQGSDASWPNGVPAFSAGNRYLAFSSWAGNLVPGDTNGTADAFVRDLRGTLAAARATAAAPRQQTASPVKPLTAHQEPRGIGNLVAPGDRVHIVYTLDTPRVRSPKGALYVRNDLQRRFTHLPLKLQGRTTLQASVPARLIRGHKLLYYAVLRDPRTGRSVTVPARGATAPQSAFVLGKAVIVRLGTHHFGHPRAPEAVVARAGPSEVSFEDNQEYHFGPQTFLVGKDRSIWLHDGLNRRLLVWSAGQPNTVARSLSLPFFAGDNDIALGPAGTFYAIHGVGHGVSSYMALARLSATGKVLWQSRLAGKLADATSFVVGSNSPLRVGPDGTLYCLAGMYGLPGGEPGWMPVATSAGRSLSAAEQRHRTRWPYQPMPGGLRLVSEVYTAHVDTSHADTSPHEARYALIDRHGRVVRAWRVLSRTDINFNYTTPELVGHDLVVVLDATAQAKSTFNWEYSVLRLGPHGMRTHFSLTRAVWGDSVLADLRIGPDGRLYQLGTSPTTGVVISRYSLGSRS